MAKKVRTFRLSEEEYRIVKQFLKDLRAGRIAGYTTKSVTVTLDTAAKKSVPEKSPIQF